MRGRVFGQHFLHFFEQFSGLKWLGKISNPGSISRFFEITIVENFGDALGVVANHKEDGRATLQPVYGLAHIARRRNLISG